MKLLKILSPLLIAALLWGCSKPKQPKLVRIKSLDVTAFSEKKVTLGGEAILYNPNSMGVTVKEIDVSVTVDDRAVGKVNQIGDITVPAKTEFEVPLVIDFAPKDIYDNLLTGLMRIISKGQLDVHYQGFIRMKAAGINFKVPVNHRDEVKI